MSPDTQCVMGRKWRYTAALWIVVVSACVVIIPWTRQPDELQRSPLLSVAPPRTAADGFLHTGFVGGMDPTYGTGLDYELCTTLPRHGDCLVAGPSQSGETCALTYIGATQLSCERDDPPNIAPELPPPRLCPCRSKRIALVRSVVITAKYADGLLRQMVAFASTATSPTDVRNISWGLVDASTIAYTEHICNKGLLPKYPQRLHERLMSYLRPESNVVRPPPLLEAQQQTADAPPWACSQLAKHPLSVPRTANDEAPPEVYYALESFAGIAGHAMELITNGIGQYVAEGLDKKDGAGVPWLVPCSDIWQGGGKAAPPLLWTRMFLELNEALQFRMFPVDFHNVLDVDRRTEVMQFRSVHFATSYLPLNAACFKPALLHRLWPFVKQRAVARNMEVVSRASWLKVAAPPMPVQSGGTSEEERGTTMYTPQRVFPYSEPFRDLLRTHNVVTMAPAGNLLRRMWDVNNAELIVTTWGSATTVASSLLLPRNDNKPRRMLVLIHPSYCDEAYRLFNMTQAELCSLHSPVVVARRRSSRHHKASREGTTQRRMQLLRGSFSWRDGAMNDFEEGGSRPRDSFCVRYVLLASLDHVTPADLEFQCTDV